MRLGHLGIVILFWQYKKHAIDMSRKPGDTETQTPPSLVMIFFHLSGNSERSTVAIAFCGQVSGERIPFTFLSSLSLSGLSLRMLSYSCLSEDKWVVVILITAAYQKIMGCSDTD